jgi:hypothetical protein
MGWIEKLVEPAVLANLIVAAAAIWYTIETQALRRTAVKQLVLMRQSMSSQLLPFVLAGIRKLSAGTEEDVKKIKEQLGQWSVRRIELPGVGTRNISYQPSDDEVFEVTSTTDEVASHVLCILFDHRSSAFRVSPWQLEVIAPRETGYFSIAKSTLGTEEMCELIGKAYESRGEYLKVSIRAISTKKESVLMPIFFDIAGRLYATPRAVHWNDDGAASYGKSDLLQPKEFSEEFAPPFETTKVRLS